MLNPENKKNKNSFEIPWQHGFVIVEALAGISQKHQVWLCPWYRENQATLLQRFFHHCNGKSWISINQKRKHKVSYKLQNIWKHYICQYMRPHMYVIHTPKHPFLSHAILSSINNFRVNFTLLPGSFLSFRLYYQKFFSCQFRTQSMVFLPLS